MSSSRLPKIATSSALAVTSILFCAHPAEAQEDVGNKLMILAQQYINDEVNSVTESNKSNRFSSTNRASVDKIGGTLVRTLEQESARIQRLRDSFRGTPNELDGSKTTLQDPKFDISSTSATLKVIEQTDLHYARRPKEQAQYTSYSVVHDFIFSSSSGDWKIIGDSLEVPPGEIDPLPYERHVLNKTSTPANVTLPDPLPSSTPAVAKPATVFLNRTVAASYAKQYALNNNPTYISYGSDCANFVSQSLYAGGWQYDGINSDGPSTWWAKRLGGRTGFYMQGNATWINANALTNYGYDYSHRFRNLADPSQPGSPYFALADVVSFDWEDANHNLGHDGKIDHVAIMTQIGSSWDDTLVSYHTNNTLNLSLTAVANKQSGGNGSTGMAIYVWDPTGY